MIRLMASTLDQTITPVLKRYKSLVQDSLVARTFTADSFLTDLVKASINHAAERFYSDSFQEQQRRLAKEVVSLAESETSDAFVEQMNRALGVDLKDLMSRESLGDFFDAAVEENIALIRSLSSEYFDDIQRQVMDSILRGDSVTVLRQRLQDATGASYRRASIIARDQTLKVSSDINRKRQTSCGISRFRWSTSQDVRVTGNPAGKYPNAKIKCFVIARSDIGYGPGVYLWSKGAQFNGEKGLFPGRAHINCRCSSIPQIEGLDYK